MPDASERLPAGTVAVVTGGSRGIGRAIALRLATIGARVAVNYRERAESAEEAVREITDGGGTAIAVQADVARREDVERLFRTVTEELGPALVLVNNAGIARDNLVLRMDEAQWDDVVKTNLRSAYLCTKNALRPMLRARWGRVISISSVSGLAGNAGQANYAAAKAGLIGFTRSIAREIGSRGITANVVAPGFIDTEMTRALPDDLKENVRNQVPLQRFGRPEEVADLVAFLASDQAAYDHGPGDPDRWRIGHGLTRLLSYGAVNQHWGDGHEIGRIFDDSEARLVVVEGDDVYEAIGMSLFDTLEKGAHLASVAACRFLPPTNPTKVVAIGLNYVAHAKESNSPLPKYPLVFLKPPSSVIGHMDPIVWPSMTEEIGYESELGVVIGKRCKNVPKERALEYVLGYSCANDVSARDCQRNDGQWSRAKGFDTFCPYGPWIETELDPGNVAISGKLNGERRQNSNTSDLVFDVKHLIWHVSQVYTLEPGDLLITGTPAGVGLMKEGDAYEVILEGIGSLKNQLMRRA